MVSSTSKQKGQVEQPWMPRFMRLSIVRIFPLSIIHMKTLILGILSVFQTLFQRGQTGCCSKTILDFSKSRFDRIVSSSWVPFEIVLLPEMNRGCSLEMMEEEVPSMEKLTGELQEDSIRVMYCHVDSRKRFDPVLRCLYFEART